MARIRTIKPEFFTSEDIVGLSPMARLLYIAIWCEADREGRMQWKPRTFKLRYFPADNCDIDALAREIIASGLVIPYGEGLAYIPSFSKHQHVNPRESASTLPTPDASARVIDASLPVSDAQVGREGKGRERKESSSPTGSRLAHDWIPSQELIDWSTKETPNVNLRTEVPKFRDYWIGKAGKEGRKLDWDATWRNWARRAQEYSGSRAATNGSVHVPTGGGRPAL